MKTVIFVVGFGFAAALSYHNDGLVGVLTGAVVYTAVYFVTRYLIIKLLRS